MNAYEIEQLEKQLRASTRLPLAFNEWAAIERRARQERAETVARLFAEFFSAALNKLTGIGRQVRATAAECTSARLRHDH